MKIFTQAILQTHFLSAYFRTPVTVKQTPYRGTYTFRATSVILKQVQPLEAAIFLWEDFFQYA